jgi:hypothetical protein
MSDIVKGLRRRAADGYPMHGGRSIFTEAADEIERLREALEKMLLWTSGEEGGPALDEAKEAARAALEAKSECEGGLDSSVGMW